MTISRQTTADVYDAMFRFYDRYRITAPAAFSAAWRAFQAEAYSSEPVRVSTWLKVFDAMTEVAAKDWFVWNDRPSFVAARDAVKAQLFADQSAA